MQVYSIAEPNTENLEEPGGESTDVNDESVLSPPEDPTPLAQPSVEEIIAAKEIEWKAQADALQSRLQSLQPLVTQMQQAEVAQREAALTNVFNRLVETSENSEEPLGDEDLSSLKTLVRKGAEMDQWYPWIQQNQVAASALIYAGAHLGRDATVGELQDLAKELATYRDPRLMQARVSMLKGNRDYNTQAARRQAGLARSATGVDRVTPAPTQSADASDYKTLELKVANNTATPAEWGRYEKLYSSLRRGG